MHMYPRQDLVKKFRTATIFMKLQFIYIYYNNYNNFN